MSASLVGSEMCIRDSFIHAWHALVQMRPHLGSKGGRAQALGRDRNHAGICLLYTSDAADDM
eukprot:9682880-Alexandrium_andersonii.AAC.1